MPEWEGKAKGGILGYKIFIFVIKYLGVKSAYFLLFFVTIYYYLFSPDTFKHIFFYFHKIHRCNFFISLLKVYQNYFVLGQTLIDKFAVLGGFENHFTFNYEGEEYLRQMADDKKGGIIIGSHTGNWEIAGELLKRLECNFNLILFDNEDQQLKKYFSEVSKEKTFKTIYLKEDLSHVYKINEAIRNKEILCFLGDRFIDQKQAKIMNFFDKPALFPTGPFYLPVMYNLPISFIFAMKENKNLYHFYATPLITVSMPQNEASRKNRISEVDKLLKLYVTELESKLRKYPLQWFNYYKFWVNE